MNFGGTKNLLVFSEIGLGPESALGLALAPLLQALAGEDTG